MCIFLELTFCPTGVNTMPGNLCPRLRGRTKPSRTSFLPEHFLGSQCFRSHIATGNFTVSGTLCWPCKMKGEQWIFIPSKQFFFFFLSSEKDTHTEVLQWYHKIVLSAPCASSNWMVVTSPAMDYMGPIPKSLPEGKCQDIYHQLCWIITQNHKRMLQS